ncbi:MAG: hypothetical protein D6732_22310 [Methanobacteriota archaeon]|nr:MAG: hypothetical protein D6732_22310 [Euryarchaeota archaeon]
MPLQNFSFLRPELAGSEAPYHTSDLMFLVDHGITDIFVLTPELTLAEKMIPDLNLPLKITHIPVYGVPEIQQLDDFVHKVEEVKSKGGKALVHCQFGQERTGIFLAYYLCKTYGYSWRDAVQEVQMKRPSSLQSPNSIEFLKKTCR